jgi:hypothetical protein
MKDQAAMEKQPWYLSRNINIVLLCYEKEENFCHRKIVADWFMETGIPVAEWQEPEKQQTSAAENKINDKKEIPSMENITENAEKTIKYEQIYEHAQNNYDKLLKAYKSVVSTPEYKDAVYAAPFEFLRMLYLAKRIDLYAQAKDGEKPDFKFTSVQEALSTYNDIMMFSDGVQELLDKAALIEQADMLAKKLNGYVTLSDYLGNDLCVPENSTVVPIAKECITMFPKAKREISPELRIHILNNMLHTFGEKQTAILASKNVFSKGDINALAPLATTDKAKTNISVLCTGFNVSLVQIKSAELNLKGVTFNNEDGTSRQEYLKELETAIKETGEKPSLTLKTYAYTPKIGSPEPAVAVYWKDKCIGNLPKDVAGEIHEKYADKVLAASVLETVGGGDVSYGVKISLNICEPIKDTSKENEKEEETPLEQAG